ncbi:Histidine-specific methyltransferase, SAM-dependent, partial [Rhizoctonia solani]
MPSRIISKVIPPTTTFTMEPLVIDVRENASGNSSPSNTVVDAIIEGLSKPSGSRSLPTLLLYNERGLRLYDDITTKAPEYYLFGCEEQILSDHDDDIVRTMGAARRGEEVVIELGAGALRKTSHFLLALARAAKIVGPGEKPEVSYYALDLERPELVRTLRELSASIGNELAGRVSFGGMWGTYDGGVAFVKRGGLQELQLNQGVSSKLDDLETERGRPTDRIPVVRTAQPTPTPSESNSGSPPHDDTLAAPVVPTISGSAAQTPNRSALPTPPSSLPSPAEKSTSIPIQLLFLGSSIGNFTPGGAIDFLRALPLRAGSGDTLLLGLDQKNDGNLVQRAYDDPQGYTRAFALNGIQHAEEITGGLIDSSKWSYVEKYNAALGRHEGYYKSNVKQTIKFATSAGHSQDNAIELDEGELVNFEYSYKYSETDALALFAAANLRVVRRWQDKKRLYSLWLLERASFTFSVPVSSQPLAAVVNSDDSGIVNKSSSLFPSIPTRNEWTNSWKVVRRLTGAWDAITIGMIPPEMLHQKPIDLRHKCLFYLGHIPAFLDIHLSRLLDEKHTEPEYFKNIFERGIDPHVDDPTQIHPHSEVPVKDEDWPSLKEILSFRDQVRARLIQLYDDFESGKRTLTRTIGRVLWMTFEHETLHAETLLYMLLQRAGSGTIPPATIVPDWKTLAKGWDAEVRATSNAPTTLRVGPADVTVGHDDFESEDATAPEGWQSSYEFGWDNEHPKRTVSISGVDISNRPITNGDYLAFLSKESRLGEQDLPASWVLVEGEICVRTLYGPVEFDTARHWPLAASYDEIAAYARAQGGRLPSEAELLAFRDQYDGTSAGKGNFAYRNWHYIPPRPSTHEERGHNGGVWEWTSTLMHAHEGYVPSIRYPGYSSDFHDEKHHIVISRRIRIPGSLRLKILQDSRLSAISLPPRPSFSKHRKLHPNSSRVSYSATAFTRERALRSYSRYESLARGELSSKRRGLNDLRGRHARIANEVGYNRKLDRFLESISMNSLITSKIVECSILQKSPLPSDVKVLGAYGGNRWSGDGPTDLSRVVEALKHCVRDWSSDAYEERTRVFTPILNILRQVPIHRRSDTKVLVPGAGLCRLAWEIARMGFDVTANEVSSYMTLPFRMMLDETATPAENYHTVCPHYSWFSHTRSNDSLFQSASFPDTLPRIDKENVLVDCSPSDNTTHKSSGELYTPGGKFELIESDFLSLSPPDRSGAADGALAQDFLQSGSLAVVPAQPRDRGYDFIVTLFFIDTATNVLAYLDQIHALLRSNYGWAGTASDMDPSFTGTWVNLGPLLWPPGASIEPSLEEVLALSERVGLSIVGEDCSAESSNRPMNPIESRRTLECQYTANRAGMMKWMYQAEFWVAKRRDD